MSELNEKVHASIERLRAFEPKNGEGYFLAFSGGKDSVVCKALLDMAGVKYDSFYSITSVDPPELVRSIKEKHPDVVREYPRYSDGTVATMWNLIPRKMMPPTRIARYCCQVLKESSGDGRMTVTGVRWAESTNRLHSQGIVTVRGKSAVRELREDENWTQNRKNGVILSNDNTDSRRMVEQCYKRHKTTLNPIIDWTHTDVWEFIRGEGIPYCELYDEGFSRLGCIGCPMASRQQREREVLRWGKYKESYLRAFDKMLQYRRERHAITRREKTTMRNEIDFDDLTPKEMFNWWMEYDTLPGQVDLFTYDDDR